MTLSKRRTHHSPRKSGRFWSHLAFLTLMIALSSCTTSRVMREHSVGDTYECVGPLYAVNEHLKFDGWFDDLNADRSKHVKFPRGTKFELVTLSYVKGSGWNTGTYHYHVAKFMVLTGDMRGKTFIGDHILTKDTLGIDNGVVLRKVEFHQ